jgi:hypothetical protein
VLQCSMPAARYVIKFVLLGGFAVGVVHAVSSRGSAVTSPLICTGRTNLFWIGDVSCFRLSNAKLRLNEAAGVADASAW